VCSHASVGVVARPAVADAGRLDPETRFLIVSLLSTVHASTSGLTTGWMPVVKPDVPRPPTTGRRWPSSRGLHFEAEPRRPDGPGASDDGDHAALAAASSSRDRPPRLYAALDHSSTLPPRHSTARGAADDRNRGKGLASTAKVGRSLRSRTIHPATLDSTMNAITEPASTVSGSDGRQQVGLMGLPPRRESATRWALA
jgi:hypothetical protein